MNSLPNCMVSRWQTKRQAARHRAVSSDLELFLSSLGWPLVDALRIYTASVLDNTI